jgi:uncharacterized membrane protein
MKSSNKGLLIVIVLVLLPFAYAAYLYPNLPASIPTHFNFKGEADAWGDKSSIYLAPAILGVVGFFLYLLLSNLKKIDPKRSQSLDSSVFQKFAIFTVLFMTLLSCAILYATTHEGTHVEKIILGIIGFSFAGMGYYMPKLKQNYFAGFKLPWTLESESNWDATHQLAGKLWFWGGLVQGVLAILFQEAVLFISFLSITVVITIVPIAFSYKFYKKNQ